MTGIKAVFATLGAAVGFGAAWGWFKRSIKAMERRLDESDKRQGDHDSRIRSLEIGQAKTVDLPDRVRSSEIRQERTETKLDAVLAGIEEIKGRLP